MISSVFSLVTIPNSSLNLIQKVTYSVTYRYRGKQVTENR